MPKWIKWLLDKSGGTAVAWLWAVGGATLTTVCQSLYASVYALSSTPPLWIGLLSIIVFACGAAVVSYVNKKQEGAPPEFVKGKSFINEPVELDGKHYDECVFTNVRFVFSGKHEIGITRCTYNGIVLAPTSKEANQTVLLMSGIGMLSKDIKIISDRPLNVVPPSPSRPA